MHNYLNWLLHNNIPLLCDIVNVFELLFCKFLMSLVSTIQIHTQKSESEDY